ncbi:MAG: type II toxin-antitoxin system HicB family antitoxin [Elusimicrobiota bacterium]
MRYRVVLQPSQDGGYAVHVPALSGCHTQGETVAEALENAKDAIRTYLRTINGLLREKKIRPSRIYEVEVAA